MHHVSHLTVMYDLTKSGTARLKKSRCASFEVPLHLSFFPAARTDRLP